MTHDELMEKHSKILKSARGLEINEGWYELVDELCNKLQEYTDKDGHNQVEAVQVKEKFGGLRFYTKGCSDEQAGCISAYEGVSYSTCEICGEPGERRDGGWISVRCDNHVRK